MWNLSQGCFITLTVSLSSSIKVRFKQHDSLKNNWRRPVFRACWNAKWCTDRDARLPGPAASGPWSSESSVAVMTRLLAKTIRDLDCRNCFGVFRELGPRLGFDSSLNVHDSSRWRYRRMAMAFAGTVADRRMASTCNQFHQWSTDPKS